LKLIFIWGNLKVWADLGKIKENFFFGPVWTKKGGAEVFCPFFLKPPQTPQPELKPPIHFFDKKTVLKGFFRRGGIVFSEIMEFSKCG